MAGGLAETGLSRLIARWLADDGAPRPSLDDVLACHAAFAAHTRQFGPDEWALLSELGLADVLLPGWWSGLIRLASQTRLDDVMAARLAAVQARIDVAETVMPRVLALRPAGPAGAAGGTATLSLVLRTDGGGPPEPTRVAGAIEAVGLVWGALCDLRGGGGAIALVGCDPEGDTTLIFGGEAEVMAELKAVLLNLWEQVMRHHDLSLTARLSTIPPTLAVMERIAATRNGDAASLRRRVLDGARRFLTAGATIPEMRLPDHFNPAGLMRARGDRRGPAGEDAVRPEDAAMAQTLAAIVADERKEMAAGLAPPSELPLGRPLLRAVPHT